MSARLQERARQMLSRTAIRRWKLRQQAHAGGAWYRLRRLLAGAERVFAVGDADLESLLAAGHRLEPAGAEVHPERRIVVAALEELDGLPSARELEVRLSADLLGERNWVLIPFQRR
jgi:hypothetical protein